MRIKPYQVIPDRWFVAGILECGDGNEYHFAVLRLPSYRWGLDLYYQEHRWLQLAIFYHGRDGFSINWLPCREQG
jgi:hypothetical protein